MLKIRKSVIVRRVVGVPADGGIRNMRASHVVLALAAVLATACQTPPPAAPETSAAPAAATPSPPAPQPVPPPPPPPPPPKPAAEVALEAAMASYDAGDYNGAIKGFASPDIAAASSDIKVKAHKYAAFSYCVTNRRTQCRQQFVEALKIDPAFALEPAEQTHPIWGPEYKAAKRSLAKPPAKSPPKPPPKPPAT
jgi:hypothetical protein